MTCGPFECAMGLEAPEITIANSPKCTNWDPTVELHMGLVDNDVLNTQGDDGDDTANDGIDLGWVTSSNLDMTVEHIFEGVARGSNGSAESKAKKGDDKSLPGANFSTAITADADAIDAADDNDAVDAVIACVPDFGETEGDSTQGGANYPGRTRSGIFKPANCIRLTGLGAAGKATAKTKGPDWLSGYTLEMSATGADVDWGSEVDWDEDPFENQTCDSVTVAAADYLDVCSLFEEEVAQATNFEDDWTFTAIWAADATDADAFRATMWTLGLKTDDDDEPVAGPERFSTLWFDDDLDTKIKNENDDRPVAAAGRDLHDLYNNNEDEANLEVVWQLMTNTDGSPNRDDFGKVDLLSDEDDDDTTDDETVVPGNPDGNADNYDADTRAFRDIRKCSDDDGDGCDAEWSETFAITFADGTFGCTAMASVTVECEWDAQGTLGQKRGEAQDTFTPNADPSNSSSFYKCTVE